MSDATEGWGDPVFHPDLVQGSDDWLAARCGLLTASEMKLIVTPTLKAASNDKERAHLYELLAQRITRFVEPTYVSDDMLRGQEDEIEARALYERHYAPVQEAGFITRDFGWGTIGYSPDGLVGDDGLIECKSRRQRFQVEVALTHQVPAEHVIQLQTGLLVTGRAWIDYLSYSGGLPMLRIRVFPDDAVQSAILGAAEAFETKLKVKLGEFNATLPAWEGIPTERRVEEEMVL